MNTSEFTHNEKIAFKLGFRIGAQTIMQISINNMFSSDGFSKKQKDFITKQLLEAGKDPSEAGLTKTYQKWHEELSESFENAVDQGLEIGCLVSKPYGATND